jgi:hypothetical protein
MRSTPRVDAITLFGVNLLTLFCKLYNFTSRRFLLSILSNSLAYKKIK